MKRKVRQKNKVPDGWEIKKPEEVPKINSRRTNIKKIEFNFLK